jgi:hypothetical protein
MTHEPASVTRVVSMLLFCILLVTAGGTGVAAAQEYELGVDNAIDVRTETVEVDRPGFSGSYEISEIAVRNSGEPLTVDVTLPDDADPTEIEVQLVNANEQLVADSTVGSDRQVTFDQTATELSSGTYSLLLVDRVTQTAMPVVISGYDISVTHPEEVSQSDELAVEGTIENTAADTPPESINIVLWNDAEEKRVKASSTGGGEYSVNTSVSDLGASDYNIYVTANGGEEYRGEQEIKAIGQGDGITVTESDNSDGNGGGDSDDDTDNGDDDSSSGGDGSGGGSSSTGSTSDDENQTDQETNTTDNNVGNDSTNSTAETQTSDNDDVVTSENQSDSPEEDTQESENTPESTDDQTPLSPAISIVSIVLVIVVIARYSQIN